jgi:hypothetical protein
MRPSMNLSCFTWRIAGILLFLAATSASAQQTPIRTTGAAGPMVGVRPKVWSAARTRVTNSTDADADMLAVIGFDLEPNVQFGRSVWVPAHSVIATWIPFHAPVFKPAFNTILKSETILLDANSAATEHAIMRQESSMIGQRDEFDNIVALLSSRDDTSIMVIAARRSIDSTSRKDARNLATVIELSLERFSSYPQTLGEFDTLVLGDGLEKLDIAQMQNIRQWVLGGGTLWIVAGETDDDHLQMLLGDAWSARTIDRTELQDYTVLQDVPRMGRPLPAEVHTDDPVELLRMAPGKNMTVLERVNGYPAAMRFPMGLGRVFVTALAPAGWATAPDKPSQALTTLSQNIFSPENPLPTVAAKLAPAVAALAPAQVGYKIVPRSLVIAVMAGFCLAFLIAGSALLRVGKMEWFVVAGVALALVASGALWAEARAVHGAVPLTVASAGSMQVFPDQPAMREQSAVVLYNPGGAAGPLESDTGSQFWPTQGMPNGRLTRLVFTDRDRWQWQDLSIPDGSMLRGNYTESTDLSQPIRARVQLSENSAEAHCDAGPFGPIQDVLLAGPNGAMLVHAAADGAIDAADADLVRNDQFISGSVLTDVQRQHQEVYRQLLADVSPITEPTLLGFGGQPFPGVAVPQDVQRRDTLLLSVPIEFVPPAVGTTMTIPSAFIPFEVVRRPAISLGLFPYQTTLHKWMANISGPQPTLQLLQFALPRSLLPMKLTDVTFDMTLRAPDRDVTLIRLDQSTPTTLVSVHAPLGLVEAKMTGADCPAIDAAGHITLGFSVSALVGEDKRTWDISDARVTVTAEKLPRTVDDAPAIRQLSLEAAK